MKDEALSITEEKEDGTARFILKGRVDSYSSNVLEFKLEKTLNEEEGPKNIVLNMFQIEYLSSAGIRVILKFYKDAKKAGGRLGIESPSESVKNVLGLTALDELLIS